MCKVTPVVTEVAVPIAKDIMDNHTQVELHAECVKHGTAVDARNG